MQLFVLHPNLEWSFWSSLCFLEISELKHDGSMCYMYCGGGTARLRFKTPKS